jgi:hypothetical protein
LHRALSERKKLQGAPTAAARFCRGLRGTEECNDASELEQLDDVALSEALAAELEQVERLRLEVRRRGTIAPALPAQSMAWGGGDLAFLGPS